MERKSNVLKGWPCGDINLSNRVIDFSLENETLFDIPYTSINNINLPSKNEIAIELNADDDGAE